MIFFSRVETIGGRNFLFTSSYSQVTRLDEERQICPSISRMGFLIKL